MTKTKTCLAIAFTSGLLACKQAGGKPGEPGGGAAGGAPGDGAGALGLYVHCFTETEPAVEYSWEGYTRWVDPAKGITGKEKTIDGISVINDYHTKKCRENLAEAEKRGATKGALAEPTVAYKAALDALEPIVVEAHTYYEHKNYKDDGFAKGKELHAKLVAAFEAWKRANATLRSTWDARHREQRGVDLAALEKKHGRKSELFVTAQVMNTAEQLIETVAAKGPPEGLVAAIATYKAAFEELVAFFGPGLTASVDTDRATFRDSADELLVQATEASRALAAGKPLPKEGDGSPAKLLEEYNALVERSNSITWD